MSWQRKYDFKNGTYIDAEQMDEEFNQLISAVNDIEASDKQKDIDLRNIAQLSKITSDEGSVKISVNTSSGDVLTEITKSGQGFHTFYAATGSKNLPPSNISIRGIAHLTSNTYGWVMAMDYKNTLYTNYLDGGSWSGWKQVVTDKGNQEILWSGAFYMKEDQEVTPTKPLADCPNGWVLVWSRYTDGTAQNNDWNYYFIHKNHPSVTAGGIWIPLVATSDNVCYKYIYVTSKQIKGHARNDDSPQNQQVLRYVFAF